MSIMLPTSIHTRIHIHARVHVEHAIIARVHSHETNAMISMDRNTREINNHALSRVFSQLFYDNSPLPGYTLYSAYNEAKRAQKKL